MRIALAVLGLLGAIGLMTFGVAVWNADHRDDEAPLNESNDPGVISLAAYRARIVARHRNVGA